MFTRTWLRYVYFPKWRPPPSSVPKIFILDSLWYLYCPYLSVYQIWCKSAKNWPIYPFCVFFLDGDRRHLGFVIPALFIHFGLPRCPRSVFSVTGVMISVNLSDILQYYHFAIVAKMAILPIFRSFWGFWPTLNYYVIILTRKSVQFP